MDTTAKVDPMKRFRQLTIAALLTLACALTVAAQRRERIVDSWKPSHYEVNLGFNEPLTEIAKARVDVSVEVLKENVSRIDFDFGDLAIDSVLLNASAARFERTPETLDVLLATPAKRGDRLKVTINYHGTPKDGLVFAKDKDGNPSATGDNWPNRVHYWIPSLDHPSAKATVSFTVWAAPGSAVVANGRWLSTTKNGAAVDIWRFEEKKPIPPYCMIVTVNRGALINSKDTATTSLVYNVPQRDREYASKGFSSAGPSLVFFNQTVAPYPYEKLALIVGATRFGGMENSSAIVFTSTLFDLRPNEKMSSRFGIPKRIEEVVAHEIAHQWFGDSVTGSTWADLWLSEGFATYFAGLFVEKYDGQPAFREYMKDAAERYFRYEQQTNTPIYDTTTTDLMRLLNANNYEKGAWVLHMLRSRMGDEAFFKGVRNYYLAHREANASTADLRNALEKASGKDLKEFFARWVYGSGHPRYELSWGTMERRAATSVVVQLNQVQTGEPFLDPVPIEFTVNGKRERRTIYPTGKLTTTTIQLPANPTAATIDPDDTLLKEVAKISP